jgi:nicotinamidase-related amidase
MTDVPRALIEGRAALIVIDIEASTFTDDSAERAIANMSGQRDRMALARVAIDKARDRGIAVNFVQEVRRPDMVDSGRDLDGDEETHCLEGAPGTAIAVAEMGLRLTLIRKRRYSAFFGTDFEIMLRGLRVDTLLPCGGSGTSACLHVRGRAPVGLFVPGDRGLRRRLKRGPA